MLQIALIRLFTEFLFHLGKPLMNVKKALDFNGISSCRFH